MRVDALYENVLFPLTKLYNTENSFLIYHLAIYDWPNNVTYLEIFAYSQYTFKWFTVVSCAVGSI